MQSGDATAWRRSSYCQNGECVEVAWRKSSASLANGSCVEAGQGPGGDVLVRNSRYPDGAVLRFKPAEWDAFLKGVRNSEFDDLAGS